MAAGLGNHWGFPCCTLGRPSPGPGYLQLAFTVWAFTAMSNVASLMLDPLIKEVDPLALTKVVVGSLL